MDLTDHIFGKIAVQREMVLAQAPTKYHQIDIVEVRQLDRAHEIVGGNIERRDIVKRFRKLVDRGSAAEEKGFVWRNQRPSSLCDSSLLIVKHILAGGIGRLKRGGRGAGNSAAAHATDGVLQLQLLNVPSNGGGGDVDLLGKILDGDDPVSGKLVQ
ncbi:hypothetical protein SDC9_150720 [bioreactor metagenome]|uniref:Uncharacterized protein n=1 Tax=bioreactor metagenome TaxID=1076179 RepID=A0A645EQ62_9ZZZZ